MSIWVTARYTLIRPVNVLISTGCCVPRHAVIVCKVLRDVQYSITVALRSVEPPFGRLKSERVGLLFMYLVLAQLVSLKLFYMD